MTACCSPEAWWKIWFSVLAGLSGDPPLGPAARHSSALLARERRELPLSRFSLEKPQFSSSIFSLSSGIPAEVLVCVCGFSC